MKIAFTLCSVNYLSQALSLGNSLETTNPQYRYIIGLVDRLDSHVFPEEITALMNKFELLEMHTLGIEQFNEMVDKYDITELNTAVKPFYIDHFFKTIPDIEQVIYFDPDILVYEELKELDENLKTYNFVITPHIMSPYKDSFDVQEQDINNTGLYNLGFIAVKYSAESKKFIEWWKERLARYCYINMQKGLFVDQIWINFLPLFFEGALIERGPGYNISYWNLHERTVVKEGETYSVNGASLKFYHFSGYKISAPNVISRYQNRFTFEQRPDIVPLYKGYDNALRENKQMLFGAYKCYYIKMSESAGLSKKYKTFKREVIKNLIKKMADYYLKKFNY